MANMKLLVTVNYGDEDKCPRRMRTSLGRAWRLVPRRWLGYYSAGQRAASGESARSIDNELEGSKLPLHEQTGVKA